MYLSFLVRTDRAFCCHRRRCVGIIHIEGTNYSIEAVPLHTVRPFVMDDMSLAEEADDAGVDLTDKAAVQKLLRNRVSGRDVRHGSRGLY